MFIQMFVDSRCLIKCLPAFTLCKLTSEISATSSNGHQTKSEKSAVQGSYAAVVPGGGKKPIFFRI